MSIMFYVRGFVVRHLVAIIVVTVGLFFVLGVGVPSLMSWKYEHERAVYQQKIDALQTQIAAEKVITQQHDERAASLEGEMVKLRDERVQLNLDLVKIAQTRATEKRRHEKDTSDFDAVRDYDQLRQLDCARSLRLGYPCPDAK